VGTDEFWIHLYEFWTHLYHQSATVDRSLPRICASNEECAIEGSKTSSISNMLGSFPHTVSIVFVRCCEWCEWLHPNLLE
jgi:hypothetical protein